MPAAPDHQPEPRKRDPDQDSPEMVPASAGGGAAVWKINFQYSDGGKIKVSSKGHITLQQAEKYYKQYGIHSDGGFYQESPYKDYEPEHLTKVIARLRKEESCRT